MCNSKKLLVIGSYYTELEIVRRAKALGYYTIVTDNHLVSAQIPAKRKADEAWNVSWNDVERLTQLCKEYGVRGVLGGFSEFRVESMIRLCNNLHLPCSLTMAQLDVTRNKNSFKSLCKKYAIPCVREYKIDSQDLHFPIIVKPVDLAGSAGISVVYNQEELKRAFDNAKKMSGLGDVILEEYIGDGTKVDVYYYVKDGEIRLLGTSDTIMCKRTEGAKVLQNAWPFPSHHEAAYIEDVDPAVRSMITGLGINNCYLTISLFWRKGQFYCFEAGFRLSGEMSFNYYEAVSGYDYLDDMIKYSMGDETGPLPNGKSSPLFSVVLNFYSFDGTIARIEGEEEVDAIPEVYDFLVYCEPDETIVNTTSVLKKVAMCTLVSPSKERLIGAVNKVNNTFSVVSTEGKDMIYERLEENPLRDYYA